MKAEMKVVPFPASPKPRDREELAFLPAALEIVETPPSPIGRAIGATLIGLFVLALAWASLSHVDIVATATGKIIPTGHSKVIQPFETGVVSAILVTNGQNVNAGDVLVELDSTINEGEIQPVTFQLHRPLTLEDVYGHKVEVEFVAIIANSSLLQYRRI